MLDRQSWGVIFVLISAFSFSTKAIFVKYAYEVSDQVTAMDLLALRLLSALPFYILILFVFKKNTIPLYKKDYLWLLVAGFMGFYASSLLDFMGLLYISASLERIIFFLYPTITVIVSAMLYKQGISLKVGLAIALSYLGTILVMLYEPVKHSQHLWLGVGLVFASAMTYASYMLMSQKVLPKFGAMRFTALATLVATAGFITHYSLVVPTGLHHLFNLPHTVYYYGFALGLFATLLPTVLMMIGIERLGAAKTAMISSGGPIFTIILAVLFLGEQLNMIQWLGCILNIIGVLMVSLNKNPPKP
ncbi:DMT family transporter [Acinetobacter sp. c2-A9]|uniref:DMT family transporter n=1 Tax=Acinetobacter sp. c2-A9 TaxID=3342802 RepID=UPI0035B7C5CA